MFYFSEHIDAFGLKYYILLCIHTYDRLFKWNYSATSNAKAPQKMRFNKNSNTSGSQNLTEADKSNSLFSEVKNVDFEWGSEIWGDFEDEKIMEATNFLYETENIKSSGKIAFKYKLIS